jgi:hypothetical protein
LGIVRIEKIQFPGKKPNMHDVEKYLEISLEAEAHVFSQLSPAHKKWLKKCLLK